MEVFRFTTLSSTMDKAKELLNMNEELIVISDTQTLGRGRQGNKWNSPPQQGLYLTYAKACQKKAVELSGLSLAIGVIIAEVLQTFGLETGVKWPNDILTKEDQPRKLAGILTETSSKSGIIESVYLGIGINLYGEEVSLSENACSIEQAYDVALSREEFSNRLIEALRLGLKRFWSDGFESFMPSWESLSSLKDKRVSFSLGQNQKMFGVVRGVNKTGELLIELDGGEVREFSPTDIGTVRT